MLKINNIDKWTLTELIANADGTEATEEQVNAWANSVLPQATNYVMLPTLIFNTFCYSIPYNNLGAFNTRLKGVLTKYVNTILLWINQQQQLTNMISLMQKDYSGKREETESESLTKNVDVDTNTTGAQLDSFNPVTDTQNVSTPILSATQSNTISLNNFANVDADVKAQKQVENETETVAKTRQYTSEQLQEFNDLQLETDRLIIPLMREVATLFQITIENPDKDVTLGFNIW